MTNRRQPDTGDDEIAALCEYTNVLIDTIDAVREELKWITRNGLPVTPPTENIGVLKQMALSA